MIQKLCKVCKKCNACQLSNMEYSKQLEYKQKEVQKLLDKYAPVNTIIGMDNPYNYRNKVQSWFVMTKSKKIVSGIYQSATHGIVETDSCNINDKRANEIVKEIRLLMKSFALFPYDDYTGRGFLRHILIRHGYKSGQIMVTLVTGTPIFPRKNDFIKALLKQCPDITTIVMNVNDTPDKMMLGNNQKVIYGKGYIEDELCGCKFRISPKSFYQVNSVQTEKLYSKAMEMAALSGKEKVIDAYCGIGTIGLIASKNAANVTGVELNRDAVRDAIENCKLNGIKNAYFISGDAGDFMVEQSLKGTKADVVFVDPPRAGCSRDFLQSLHKVRPQKIVYISCNPVTLERDMRYLTRFYEVKEIQPVDMFPHTSHVETVCLLESAKNQPHISFTVNMEDLPRPTRKSATYDEIKAYVSEKHGLKVSSLYIAQIKEKHGLKERENYNIGNGKSKELVCPPEKEQAILDAFKHFGMIK